MVVFIILKFPYLSLMRICLGSLKAHVFHSPFLWAILQDKRCDAEDQYSNSDQGDGDLPKRILYQKAESLEKYLRFL